MRTQILLLTAALGVAGASTTMAQVYSVNAVGYVNMSLKTEFSIIANPLDNKTSNKVADLLAGAETGTTVYKFVNGNYDISGYDPDLFGGWEQPDMTMVPGEGAWVLLPADKTFTFVGEVMQGDLVNATPDGFSLKGSQVPQAGKAHADLNLPVADGLTVYFWRNSAYDIYSYDEVLFDGWDNGDPTVGVGEGFWLLSPAGLPDWTRSFSVNTN